jgi:prepilin-type processing-associated H-X9-DG protein
MPDPDESNAQSPPVLEYATPRFDEPRFSPWPITSVLCGLVSLCLTLSLSTDSDPDAVTATLWVIFASAAVIFGVRGFRLTDKRDRAGQILSIAAVAIGSFSLMLFASALPGARYGRHRSNIVKCSSNLRQIGQGIALYASDNGGKFPTQLGQLITDGDINPEVLVCPDSDDTKATGATTQQILANFAKKGHCSYVYLGAGMTSKTVLADTVVAHENIADHIGGGMNVLFGDGHVDWLGKNEATYLLKELQDGHNPPRPVMQPHN